MKRVILLLVLILLICSGFAFAAVPCKINYQGRLIENNVPVDGTKTMVFSIYTVATEGSPIWTSGDVSVTVYNGLFRYVLGEGFVGGNPVTDLSSIPWTAGETLYLQVQVGNDILTPREPLSAYPYAINSHLLEGATKEYFLNTSGDTQTKQGNLNIGGNLGVGGDQFEHKGYNFLLGTDDGRGKGNKELQRALVHDGNDKLFINYNTDFEGGVKIEPSVYISTNGNVGIGTMSPQAKLHIGGSAGVDGIRFPDDTLMTTAAAIGTVANVVMVQTRQQATYSAPTSGNGTVITPLNLVITPKKAGNRIILEWIVNGEMVHDAVYIVTRNGVLLDYTTNVNNNRWAGITAQPYDTDNHSTPDNAVVKIIDMNSLDVETTYALRVRSSSSTAYTLYLNRTVDSAGQDMYEAGLSVGTATEIWW